MAALLILPALTVIIVDYWLIPYYLLRCIGCLIRLITHLSALLLLCAMMARQCPPPPPWCK